MITQELFNRFLQNECNEEERKQVMQYLTKHPEALEHFLPQDEFLHHEPVNKAGEDLKDRLLLKIRKRINRTAIVRRTITRVAAAAMVLLIIGSVWKFFAGNKAHPVMATEDSKKQRGNEEVQWQSFTASESELHIVMPDSTKVDLSPHSALKYGRSYGMNGKRDVYLSGEAFFKVAKDKARPFTVYSGAIATTALGTAFTVQAQDNLNVISVHLYEGKVVVRPADSASSKLFPAQFLFPGDILFYNKATGVVSIRKGVAGTGHKVRNNYSTAGQVYKPDWYEFNKQPLADVLDQLSFYYQVNINYNKELGKLNFITPQFRATDSLYKILYDIALLNNLVVVKSDGGYVIKTK